jgi:hypothetical protein
MERDVSKTWDFLAILHIIPSANPWATRESQSMPIKRLMSNVFSQPEEKDVLVKFGGILVQY